MEEVWAAVMTVGTSIMGSSTVAVGASVVVGRGDALLKKLGVTGTATPTPETVTAKGAFVVRVDRVVGVTGSDEKVNGASVVVDVAPSVVVRDSVKGNSCVPVVGLESEDASVLELVEPSVALEKFPVPWTMDPLGANPLRLEEMEVLAVCEAPIADWAAFAPSPAADFVGKETVIPGTSPAVVAAVDADGEVVLTSPDVDNVDAVDAVESSVLGLVVAVAVAVLRDVSVREMGTTWIVAATESVVLVVF
mgnify:CR=1 FL=1